MDYEAIAVRWLGVLSASYDTSDSDKQTAIFETKFRFLL